MEDKTTLLYISERNEYAITYIKIDYHLHLHLSPGAKLAHRASKIMIIQRAYLEHPSNADQNVHEPTCWDISQGSQSVPFFTIFFQKIWNIYFRRTNATHYPHYLESS